MLTSMRQAIARHMAYSKQNIPHYYLTMRAEMSAALNRREEWNAGRTKEDTVSINDLVVKATVLALREHAEFNAYFQDNAIQRQERLNIGIAIALPDGLLAPALLDCQRLSLAELAVGSRALAARAREGRLKAEEYTAATFTITNLGMYHVESFTAIIVPPQVAILAVGAIETRPALQNSDLITEHRMALTLSADHRATDGVEGARFLGEIITNLQDPEKLFD